MQDFNDADQQLGDVIPAGTIAPVVMEVRPGRAGETGHLTASKSSDAQYLDCEFTVTEGPFAKRKFWQNFVVSGGKVNEKGQSIAANISRATLRAILESARNIKPNDMSEQALAARRTNNWGDFSGLIFLCKIGIEKDKTGQYEDKNKILAVITPDKKQYANGPVNWTGGGQAQGGAAPAGGQGWGAPAPAAGGGQGWGASAPAARQPQGQQWGQAPANQNAATPPPPVQGQGQPQAPAPVQPASVQPPAEQAGPAGSAVPPWANGN